MTNVTPFPLSPEGHDVVLEPVFCEEHAVRMMLRDDEPWFVLADLCKAYGLTNPSMVAETLDTDEKETLSLTDSLIKQGLSTANPGIRIIIVNEAGMYSITGRSDKPVAKKFWKRVRTEILPAIRKTGRYEAAPAKPLTEMELLEKSHHDLGLALASWRAAEEKLLIADARTEEQRARADHEAEIRAEVERKLGVAKKALTTLMGSENTILMTEAYKACGTPYPVFFSECREYGYIWERKDKIIPRQEYVRMGIFEYNAKNGFNCEVTEFGIAWLTVHMIKTGKCLTPGENALIRCKAAAKLVLEIEELEAKKAQAEFNF